MIAWTTQRVASKPYKVQQQWLGPIWLTVRRMRTLHGACEVASLMRPGRYRIVGPQLRRLWGRP
jgi:hypothetical protein